MPSPTDPGGTFTDRDRRMFLKQLSAGIMIAGAELALPMFVTAAGHNAGRLPRSLPASEGIDAAAILKFLDEAERTNAGFHSIMILRHGRVVAEGWWYPYAPGLTHWLYSLSKNVTATAVGLLIDEGRLQLTDKVVSFFPDDLPPSVGERLAAMTVRDLLTMSSGHERDTLFQLLGAKDGNWRRAFLAVPPAFDPGTHFTYNSGCTYMLSAIVQKLSGSTMLDYLRPRLLTPLGIEGASWDTDPQGINVGAAGLHLKTEDLTKFGQLYLQQGMWNGKKILSRQWVTEATRFQIRNDETGTPTKKEEDDIKQGYGYHFWLSRPQAYGAYRSEGAFCQYSIVMPEQDAVIAITAEGRSTKRAMDLVWDILLPAMKPAKLPWDKELQARLNARLGSLTLKPPVYNNSPGFADGSFKPDQVFKLEENPAGFTTVRLKFYRDLCECTFTSAQSSFIVRCGFDNWIIGETNMPGSPVVPLPGINMGQTSWKVAAAATWKDANTFLITRRYFETPHSDYLACIFSGDEITLRFTNSVTSILNTFRDPRPVLKGKVAG